MNNSRYQDIMDILIKIEYNTRKNDNTPVGIMSRLKEKSEGRVSVARKTKATKDPNKPNPPQSAYFLWLNENRGRIKAELVEKEESSKMSDVAKEAGKQWKLVSAEEKAPFEEQAESEKQRYKEEMSSYFPVHRK